MNEIEKLALTYKYIFSPDKTAKKVLDEHNANNNNNNNDNNVNVNTDNATNNVLTESKEEKNNFKAGFSVHVLCNCGSPELAVNEGLVECSECGHKEKVNG